MSYLTFALNGTIYTEGNFVAWMQAGFEMGWNGIQISALPLGCMPLEKLLNLFEPCFPLLHGYYVD